jgi:two-component sensor histidine kinase
VGVVVDVTQDHAAAERQTLLAREVDHRAKNVLAVVQSILRLTRADSPRAFADAVEGRVAALARAHSLLARGQWSGTELQELLEVELAPYTGGRDATPRAGHRLVLAGPGMRLRPEAVQPFSMTVHELATNSAKHGALSLPGGSVRVSWFFASGPDAAAPPVLQLRWEEAGGPQVLAPPERRGFGSRVIRATIVNQLGGQVRFDWLPEGLRCELTVAADRLLPSASVPRMAPDQPALPAAVPANRRHPGLAGKRVLLMEDTTGIATRATLEALGCVVLGPASSLGATLRLARTALDGDGLDAAVFDIAPGGRPSFPVADLLGERDVPVIFTTRPGELAPGRTPDGRNILLARPLAEGDLAAALLDVLTPWDRRTGRDRREAGSRG